MNNICIKNMKINMLIRFHFILNFLGTFLLIAQSIDLSLLIGIILLTSGVFIYLVIAISSETIDSMSKREELKKLN